MNCGIVNVNLLQFPRTAQLKTTNSVAAVIFIIL